MSTNQGDLTTTVTADATTVSAPDHAVNDTLTVRLVVSGLILSVFAIIICSTVLALNDKYLPPELTALGGVGLGALGAMLASTASRRT